MALADTGLPDSFRHIELATTSSTNNECLMHAEQGDRGNLWVTAKVQTAARGSRGRQWQSDEGNLFASLLLINPAENPDAVTLSNLTFVASLALLRAIKDAANQINVELKWPNDVLINGKKCAGILLENHTIDGKKAVIVGIGVNCRYHPTNTNYPACNLAQEGVSISPDQLFLSLARQMELSLGEWDKGRGFDDTRNAWLQHASGLGKQITVKIPGRADDIGIFETIDEKGLLVLKQDNDIQKRISSADIFI